MNDIKRTEQNRKADSEHYIKYCKVADIFGLAKQDVHLNNTPLSKWDSLAFQMKHTPLSKQQREELSQIGVNCWALYLGACTYKTLVYRDILKMNVDEYCDFNEKYEG